MNSLTALFTQLYRNLNTTNVSKMPPVQSATVDRYDFILIGGGSGGVACGVGPLFLFRFHDAYNP